MLETMMDHYYSEIPKMAFSTLKQVALYHYKSKTDEYYHLLKELVYIVCIYQEVMKDMLIKV